jgi:acetyl-CoA carboxylase biotin carboxylase subunit
VTPKVLIANRGEIAVRIVRACRELGLGSVAVFSDADRDALHVRLADQAMPLGASPAVESYLNIGKLIDVALRSGATYVHPGYGFLAENARFARACAAAGLMFVGPSPDAIELMGSKTAARRAAIEAGAPVVPGTDEPFGPDAPDASILGAARAIGFPLLVKAVAGGGGKGMRTVAGEADLPAAIRAARSEAAAAFGDAAVYLEKAIASPRHIEVQLLGDHFGHVQTFVERECSIQRRHQKVVEESPSTVVTPDLRREIAGCAARIARRTGYTNAGTIEFLLEGSGADARWFFLEMNTRLQVEHPVTEMVTGIDLVQWQLRIASGERLTIPAIQAMTPRGHAIECRVYAEDPDNGFLPSPGVIKALALPQGPGVRDDGGIRAGFAVSGFYDSMISKLVVWGADRKEAIARLRRALDEYKVVGVRTTLPFFRWLVEQPEFAAGEFDTTYLDGLLAKREGLAFNRPSDEAESDAAIAAAIVEWLRIRRGAGADHRGPSERWRQIARAESIR